jgi:hypothetical protein
MAQILEGIEDDDILNRPLSMIIFVIVALLSVDAVSPVSAIIPTVQEVVPYDVGGSTYLNITVHHTPQDPTAIPPHYVNIIKVTMGTNTTQLTINSIPVSPPNNNFTVTYDLGPISGTPSITVDAHCLVNGWASQSSGHWTGAVPEFSLPMLLLVMIAVLSIGVFVSRKAKTKG